MSKVLHNQEIFRQLRQSHPEMTVHFPTYSFKDNQLTINYIFEISGGLSFAPSSTIIFPDSLEVKLPKNQILHEFIAALAMVESMSYWKSVCPPRIITNGFSLTDGMVHWWHKLFINGLGEFFYTNGINTDRSDDLLNIVPSATSKNEFIPESATNYLDVIVPIGGGKDSVVTLEMLLTGKYNVVPLIINPRGATLNCINVAGFERSQIIEIQRSIDPKLLELNAKGFLNGHTPFSAMLAFYASLSACMAGIRYVALSNESSANESTVPGLKVNHQYSKSFEFETDFRRYIQDYIIRDLEYFSFLRPLSELQIASLFSKLTKYHTAFRSCNVGSKTDEWCGNCPKCLFTAIILSPFIPPNEIEKIFCKDMLDDPSIIKFLDELCGIAPIKPFECVGTIEEVNLAISSAINIHYLSNPPHLLQHYLNHFRIPDNTLATFSNELKHINDDHCVPEKMMNIIIDRIKNDTGIN